jgi:hypothetical protein
MIKNALIQLNISSHEFAGLDPEGCGRAMERDEEMRQVAMEIGEVGS